MNNKSHSKQIDKNTDKKNILIIEDHFLCQQTYRAFLPESNYSLKIAGTGEEGLRFLNEQPYDCILLDLGLPDMPGQNVLKAIRHYKNIPIIVITAHADSKIQNECLSLGANKVITKPVAPIDLREIIQAVITEQ